MLAQLFNRRKNITNLYVALNRELRLLGSTLVVSEKVVKKGNRHCRVFGKYVDFWENGLQWLGLDGVSSVRDRAKMLYYWIDCCYNSDEIEARIPGVTFPESRKKIENGEQVFLGWYWENLKRKKNNRFGELIDLFASHENTRGLMSYIEARDFGLCRNIGKVNGLELRDLPSIRIRDDWKYEVHLPNISVVNVDGEIGDGRNHVGVGTAREAFEIALRFLPTNAKAQYYRCNGCPPAPSASAG
ncbi:MAG TPA: hypothetical protein ENJ82_00915 [Bacteroidetes bacterium]|nr:hypothetical protein [Bacteroidota bacterium]